MAQRIVRPQQAALVGQLRQVFLQHLLRVDDGAYLQQVELARPVVVDVAGQLYFHRPLHAFSSELHRHLQQLGERKDPMLEHAAKRNHLAAAFVVAVADHLVGGIEGAGDVAQRAVLVGFLHTEVEDVETVVHLELVADVIHVERIETRLRLLQRNVHLAHLHHLVGMIGTHAQRLSAVNDVLA